MCMYIIRDFSRKYFTNTWFCLRGSKQVKRQIYTRKLVSDISASLQFQSCLFLSFTQIDSAKLYVAYETYIVCMWIWLTHENA